MSSQNLIDRHENAFYNGKWHRSKNCTRLCVVNPSNGTVFKEIRASTQLDVDHAISSAVDAFPQWRLLPGSSRAHYLRLFSRGLMARKEGLIELQMINSGKPKIEAEMDVTDAIATFDYYSELAEQLDERQGMHVNLAEEKYTGKTRFEPIGPVGMIVPWNFPLVTSAWKIAPALAAGCTVVMKNSEITPLIELVYGDIAQEANLPAGVFNILTGGTEAGIALTNDRRLRKISFTGSNMVGAKVMKAVSSRCLPVSLELGGKSPIVVFDDADIDQAVESIMAGIFFNCGQMCSATSRLVIDQKISADLIEKLVTKTNEIIVGSPINDSTQMGPITAQGQFEKVQQIYKQANLDRIKCLTGGNIKSGEGGFFVEPTIYMDVPENNPVWREEIFGPALAVKTFNSIDQALRLANDSEYALVATIISNDIEKAEWAAAQIDGGHIWINSPQIIFPNTAWGGFKASGIGRELGPWGLSAYQGIKHLTIKNQGG